jgi:hypothetical protein
MTRPNFYPNWAWWLTRVSNPDHQRMYDYVSGAIPIGARDVFLEVGSGTG